MEGLPVRILTACYAITATLIAALALRYSGGDTHIDIVTAPPSLTEAQGVYGPALAVWTLIVVVGIGWQLSSTTCFQIESSFSRMIQWAIRSRPLRSNHDVIPGDAMVDISQDQSEEFVPAQEKACATQDTYETDHSPTTTETTTTSSSLSQPVSQPESQPTSRTPTPPVECLLTRQVYPPNPTMQSKTARLALDALQRLVITAHIRLSSKRPFALDQSFTLETIGVNEWFLINHPIQDATGSLFLTLLSIRRNRPSEDAFLNTFQQGVLKERLRRDAAARYSVACKFNQHGHALPHFQFVQELMSEFLLECELPRYTCEWRDESNRLKSVEAIHITKEPWYMLQTDNPLSWAERILYGKILVKQHSRHDAIAMRGCLFFLLGTCMLNPVKDVLETLTLTLTNHDIGTALVSIMETLLKARKTPPVLYKAPHSAGIDNAAFVILKNALAPHAAILRAGPYNLNDGSAHPVRRLLTVPNLQRAYGVFRECLDKY